MKKILMVLGLFAGIVVLVSGEAYLFPDPKQALNCVDWWRPLIAFPEGIAAWAVIFTLIVIGWQSYETAQAAKFGALSAQGFVNSERALIVIRSRSRKRSSDADKCKIIGINRGRTSAQVCSISNLIDVQAADSQVPGRALEPLSLPRSALTTSGHYFPVREVSFEWCKERLEKAAMENGVLLVFIEVKYWDMFTDKRQRGATPHVTRMCFTVDPYNRGLHRYNTDWTCHE
jgi:hypothetical protein